MTCIRRIGPSILAIWFLAVVVRAQQPPDAQPPVFRAAADLVQVDVSVLDKNRKPVRGLTAADFTVLEDGVPRPVVAFTPVDLPPRAPLAGAATWPRDIAPDVTTNDVSEEGRLVVIVFDWSIRFDDQPTARRIARAVVDQLGPGDLATVIFTNQFANGGIPQNFTADRARLLAAIEQPFATALVSTDSRSGGSRLIDPEGYTAGDCYCRLCVPEALATIADTVRDVPGRRKVMFFVGTYFRGYEDLRSSPGDGRSDSAPCASQLDIVRKKMVRATGLANLTIDVFDPAGLVPKDRGPIAERRPRERLDDLQLLADFTGGRAVFNTNAPEEHVPAIFEESDSYYLLGFAPANPRADGALHRIEVKARPKGVTLRTREGYYAPSATGRNGSTVGTAPPSLVSAMSGVLPATDTPLSVSAAVFAQPGRREGVVAIVVGGQWQPPDPGTAAASDRTSRSINVMVAALDRNGVSVGTGHETVTIHAAPGSPGARVSYEARSRFDLKPGHYEIRAATDAGTDARGSVYTFVDVPDFSKEALSLSGVVLDARPSVPSAAALPFADVVPIAPTARRDFATTDLVTTFLRVYQGGNGVLAPVPMTMRIVDRNDRALIEERTALAPERFAADRAADYQIDLPVARLMPGEYLLTIEAALGKRTVRRDVRFRVR